ncbi:hypothetical protein ILYODFUR_026472, partial [Ilyodon furcidens]
MVQGANGGRQREREDGTYSIGEDAGLTRRSNQSSCHEETMSERRTGNPSMTPEPRRRCHDVTTLSSERHSGTCWVMSSLQFHQGSPGPSVENETISEQGGQVKADPSKIQAVVEWPTPTTRKQLQRFSVSQTSTAGSEAEKAFHTLKVKFSS